MIFARPKPGSHRPSRLPYSGSGFAAFLPLLALLIILASPLLPAMARILEVHHTDGGCRGDHRLCGCAPARIANNTCCCARPSTPSCCAISGQKKNADQPVSEEGRRVRILSTLPCGDGEPATLAAGDPWLPEPAGSELSAGSGFTAYLPAAPTAKPSPSLQPDVPPPQPAPVS